MKRRIKRYEFTDVVLYHKGINADDMELFFSKLPLDAKIVRWGSEHSTCTSYFIVEDSSFQEVSDCEKIPVVKFDFEENEIKQYEYNNRKFYIHEDTVNAYNNLVQDMNVFGTGAVKITGEYPHVKWENISPVQGIAEYQKAINEIYSDVLKQQTILGNDMGVIISNVGRDGSKNTIRTLSGPKIECDHEWKTYDSGFTTKYDYCSKCDVKK